MTYFYVCHETIICVSYLGAKTSALVFKHSYKIFKFDVADLPVSIFVYLCVCVTEHNVPICVCVREKKRKEKEEGRKYTLAYTHTTITHAQQTH